jgi:hypothetical protein
MVWGTKNFPSPDLLQTVSQNDAGFDLGGASRKTSFGFGTFNPQRRENSYFTQTSASRSAIRLRRPFTPAS